MRKKTAFLLAAVLACSLCACSARSEVTEVSLPPVTSEQEATSQVESAPQASLSLVSSYIGPSTMACAENGFYQSVPNAQGGSNLLYTDYATQSTVYLCTAPNCLHNSEGCTSWMSSSNASLFLNGRGDVLFAISSDEGQGVLQRMNLDGSERTTLYTCASGEELVDAVAADEENLYIALSYVGEGNSGFLRSKHLVRLDQRTGNREDLLDYEASDWLFGAYEDKLLILYLEENRFSYRAYSLTDGSLTDIYSYKYEGASDDPFARPSGFYLYKMEPQGGGTAQMVRMDMRTGEETVLNSSCPYYGAEGTSIIDVSGMYLYVSSTDYKTLASESYLVNSQTGEATPSLLTFQQGDITAQVVPVAVVGNDFLAHTGIQAVPIMLVGNDGVPYSSEIDEAVYALISQADFLQNIPNYTEFTHQYEASE